MNPPDSIPDPEPRHAWERRLAAELRDLPELTAPASLLSDVMAIVRQREAVRARPWWRRPVPTWPPALRVGFGVAAFAVLGALVLGVRLLWPEVQSSPEATAVAGFSAKVAALGSAARAVVDAIGLALSSLVTPGRLAILAAVILVQLALLGAGAAAFRALLSPRPAG